MTKYERKGQTKMGCFLHSALGKMEVARCPIQLPASKWIHFGTLLCGKHEPGYLLYQYHPRALAHVSIYQFNCTYMWSQYSVCVHLCILYA